MIAYCIHDAQGLVHMTKVVTGHWDIYGMDAIVMRISTWYVNLYRKPQIIGGLPAGCQPCLLEFQNSVYPCGWRKNTGRHHHGRLFLAARTTQRLLKESIC